MNKNNSNLSSSPLYEDPTITNMSTDSNLLSSSSQNEIGTIMTQTPPEYIPNLDEYIRNMPRNEEPTRVNESQPSFYIDVEGLLEDEIDRIPNYLRGPHNFVPANNSLGNIEQQIINDPANNYLCNIEQQIINGSANNSLWAIEQQIIKDFNIFSQNLESLINQLNAFSVYKSIGELEINKTYTIKSLKLKNTEYGPALEAILQEGEEEVIKTFLPKRYTECFTTQQLDNYDGKLQHIREQYVLYTLPYRRTYLFVVGFLG